MGRQRFVCEFKEVDGQKFFFTKVGNERHGRPSFIMWISSKLVNVVEEYETRYCVDLPLKDATIVVTDKGTKILKPCEGVNVFHFIVPCGYRGSSQYEVIDPVEFVEFKFYEYESQLGSLGISAGALIVTKADKVKVKWHRTGRLYGAVADGVSILTIDGNEEELPISDFDELNEIKT